MNNKITALLFLLLGLPISGWNEALAEDSSPAAPERAFYTVTLKDAEKMIGDALVNSGAGNQVHVLLFGDHAQPLRQAKASVATRIEDLQFDQASGRIEATLHFISEGASLAPARLSGRYEEMLEVPILTRQVERDTTISESDIATKSVPARRLRKDTVMQAEKLIGKTPKQRIGAGRPIRDDELTEASTIKKGAAVTLRYQTGNMLINTLGEAIEPGTTGSHIRVRNTTSNAIVRGTVESANVVSVTSLSTP